MAFKTALLTLETVLALTLAWGAVFLIPFRWTQKLLGSAYPAGAVISISEPPQMSRALWVGIRVRRTADRLPWHSTCLVRAIAGQLLLKRRGIHGGLIRLGVKKEDGTLAAHAWLIYGPQILLGGDEAEAYTPLSDIGT